MPRALLSVSDKTGIEALATGLAARGFELISTGGTARSLQAAGLEVVAVSDVTGSPEMLEGRVKTLHPAIHGGILARRSRPDDLATIERHGIHLIDLVVVNLYPFAEAAARPDLPVDDLFEEIDIGGPTLVRAAAKSMRDVLVVVDPRDYEEVLTQLDAPDGASSAFRLALARKAFAHTAAYDQTIASTLDGVSATDGALERRAVEGPGPRVWLGGARVQPLRYGENPHQAAAFYDSRSDEGGFGALRMHQGKALSFTNLLDLDAAARIALEFDEPAAVVIKHTNPCGVAVGDSAAEAYVKAREADSLSAFGGIVGLNRPLDADTATALTSTFIEAVVAPAIDDAAAAILATKPSMRVVTADLARFASAAEAGYDVRSILGGLLVQGRDVVAEARPSWPPAGSTAALSVATRRAPTDREWTGLRFAWRVCAHVKSNAVIFTASDRTLAIGAGQMSRVDAVKVAVLKAGSGLDGSVAASDAFFPFPDGVEAIAEAGATAVVQPGGSRRDAAVIEAADRLGLAMVLTGTRHFRH